MNEFCECLTLFEFVKQAILNCLLEIDWLNVFVKLYNFEDENTNLTRVSILRILLQSARIHKEVIEMITSNKPFLQILIKSMTVDEPIISGTSIQIMIILLKNIMNSKKDISELNLPLPAMMDLFEKNIHSNPFVSIITINMMGELLLTDTAISNQIIQRFQNV